MRIIILLFFFLLKINVVTATNHPYSDRSPFYDLGEEVENEIKITDKYKFPLPPGKWKVVLYSHESVDTPYLNAKGYVLLNLVNGNEIKEAIEIVKIHTGVQYVNRVDWYIVEEITFDDEDEGGCYKRPEYNYLFLYRKGFGHNCLRIAGKDIAKKSIHDEPEDLRFNRELRSKYKFPKVLLQSYHSFYSRSTKPEMFIATYYMNSKFLGAPALKGDIETSEFHPFNIDNHPKHKKALAEFVNLAKKRHVNFEKFADAPTKMKLKLGISNNLKQKKINKQNFVSQLQILEDLYKKGSLTKSEYEKAKQKLLKN